MTITGPQLDRLVRKAAKPAAGLAGKPAAAIRPDRDQVKDRENEAGRIMERIRAEPRASASGER